MAAVVGGVVAGVDEGEENSQEPASPESLSSESAGVLSLEEI